jgi:DNA-binding CsgD family transcriptional regulator/tetratricopeptide (TPR) repeat protein
MTAVVDKGSTPLVGRLFELRALRSALEQVAAGRPRVAVVTGEAGIGKSRLVHAFTTESADEGVFVMTGGCGERSAGSLPYAPLVGALRGLPARPDWPELRRQLHAWLAPLGRLVPALAEGLDPPAEVDQPQLFEFVLAVLRSLGQRAPVVLVLEDLHWADQSSLDLISFLVRNVRTERLMLVLTYRNDELARSHDLRPIVAELVRDRRVLPIDLTPFGHTELSQLVANTLHGTISAALVTRLLERSDGNPFFAEELLAAGAAGVQDPPEMLRDVVLSRVDRLAADTQAVLRAAAVAGRQVDGQILAGVCGLDGQRLGHALREAVAHRVLIGDSARAAYRFRHWLAQDAIYRDLPYGERAEQHAQVAAALQEVLGQAMDPALAAEVAHHWHAANRRPEAFAASVRAGRAAINALAYVEALGHLKRAHELAQRLPGADAFAGLRAGELLELLAEASRWTSDLEGAVALANQALAKIGTDRLRTGLLHDFLGRCLWEIGDSDGSLAAYRQAGRLLPADAPGQDRARAMAGEAGALMLNSRYQESAQRAQEAIALASDVDAVREHSHALCTLGVDLSMLGDLPGAIQTLKESLRLAEQIGNLEEICRSYTNLSSVLEVAGRLEEAAQVAREGLDRARRHGLELTGGGVLAGNAVLALFKLGRWDQADEVLDAVLPGLTGMMRAHVTMLRAGLLTARGEFARAAAELAAAKEMSAQVTEAQLLGPLYALDAELAILTHRPRAALSTVRDGLMAVEGSEDRHLVVRLCALGVRALADHDERVRTGLEPVPTADDDDRPALVDKRQALADAARQLADTARHGIAELATRGAPVPEAEADLAECLAELGRLTTGNRPQHWDPALELWAELGQPYRAAYVRYRKAEAMTGARNAKARKDTAALLRQARDEAAALGAEALKRDAEALATAMRLDLTDTATKAAATPATPRTLSAIERIGLTPREQEILRLLVTQGLPNKKIATVLSTGPGGTITESTVAVHVSNIMRKLGVQSRGEAITKANRIGLFPQPLQPEPPAEA